MGALNSSRYPLLLLGWAVILTGCDHPKVIFPERKQLTETVYASGKIISKDEFRLASLSNGTILQKMVKDGDTVHKGQLIYVVENDAAKTHYEATLKNVEMIRLNLSAGSPVLNDLRLAIQRAMLECSNDSSVYARYKILWAENIGTQNNLDNMRLKYESSLSQLNAAKERYNATIHDLQVSRSMAESQLVAADKNLQESYIRSDRDGIVYQTLKEPGETVMPNEVVALIGGGSNHIVRMAVDQQDINKIHKGQTVLVQADVAGGTIYTATVSYIYPVMNEQDQTFRVDAVFSQEEPLSFIHSSVEANIIILQKQEALVLPRSVLAGGDSVWVKIKSGKERRQIITGISTLEYIEVLSGLTPQTPVLLINNK